jgi:CRISPR-associated protein Csx10
MNQYSYLPYSLKLNSSVIITAPGGDANSSSTLPYIPGLAVRGALAKALGDPGVDSSRQHEFHELVLGGMVRYLNAYPIINKLRALPTPVSLRLRKYRPENKRDTIDTIDLAADDWPEEELIPIPEDFLTLGAAQPALYHPKISSRIHHQRDREKGRAWKDPQGNTHGAIFTFESLEVNQAFAGLILLRSKKKEELDRLERRIKELLGNTLLVGRSRRSGYGGMASIEWGNRQHHETEGVGKEGLRPLNRNIGQGEQFRLLMISPCIARNSATGQPDPAALEDKIVNCFSNRVEVIRKVWTFVTIGGFNRKWRLELPQTLAVSAGSVLVLEANQAISLDELHEIEHEGLGERKGEGYGRLLFLDAPLPEIVLHKFTESPTGLTINGAAPLLVRDIESRIVQAQIARMIEEKAAVLARSANNLPTNSLIGRLRTPLRGATPEAISTLKLWLTGNESERLKRPAMDQMERCKIDDGKNLHTWILDAMDRDMILKWLQVGVLAQRLYVVSIQSAESGVEEKFEELSVKLIDAVLADLAIRNKTQEVDHGL